MEKKETIIAVTFILAGAMLQIFNGIGNGWATPVVSIFGLVLFLIGLKNLKDGLDPVGQNAVKMLIVAAILGLVGLFFDLIPLLGWLAKIIFIVAFVFELVGFIKLKDSTSIGEAGKTGAGLLVISMILAIVASIFWLVPVIGGTFTAILSLVALYLVFSGWEKIQMGISGENALKVRSVTFILVGTLLLLCNTATNGWASAISSLFGLYLLLKGLTQLNDNIDAGGQSGVKLLIYSVFIGIAASVLNIIASLVNLSSGNVLNMSETSGFLDIVVIVVFAATYIVQFMGYMKLKESSSIGEPGKKGVQFLMISMIVAALGSLIGLIPLSGIVTPIFALAGLALIFFGWVKIQEGIITQFIEDPGE